MFSLCNLFFSTHILDFDEAHNLASLLCEDPIRGIRDVSLQQRLFGSRQVYDEEEVEIL